MAERVQVSSAEAASVIVTMVLGEPFFFSEKTTKKIRGEEADFSPKAIEYWNTIFRDEYRSRVLIASVTAILDLAPLRAERGRKRIVRNGIDILKLRSGLKDGLLRDFEETAQDANTTIVRIRRLQDYALRTLRHPSLGIIIHQFAPGVDN